jgi:hypothetical protein
VLFSFGRYSNFSLAKGTLLLHIGEDNFVSVENLENFFSERDSDSFFLLIVIDFFVIVVSDDNLDNFY